MRNPTAVVSLLALSLLATGRLGAAEDKPPAEKARVDLQVGAAAPTFESVDERGQPWSSVDHVGKQYVVVYFYPADFTSGCIKQAETFRDTMNLLADSGVAVIGVSGDAVRNHALFKQSWSLNYTLLADESGEVAAKFGVPATAGGQVMAHGPDRKVLTDENGERFRLERKTTFARWTFIIGKDGKILYKNTKVIPANDAKQVLEFIQKLEKESTAVAQCDDGQTDVAAEVAAITEIRKRGGTVEVDEGSPGHPAITVQILGCRALDGDLVFLQSLPRLRTVHLGHGISKAGLIYVAGLTHVEKLVVQGAPITGESLVHLVGLTKLHTLDLENSGVDDNGLALLKDFKELRTLNLAGTQITNKGLEHLKELTDLESLNLDFAAEELTDEAIVKLKGLTRLKTLVLSNSKLTDAGLESLKGLTALETLNIEVTEVTTRGIEDFQKALPKVKVTH